jgi:hypothetical protein
MCREKLCAPHHSEYCHLCSAYHCGAPSQYWRRSSVGCLLANSRLMTAALQAGINIAFTDGDGDPPLSQDGRRHLNALHRASLRTMWRSS